MDESIRLKLEEILSRAKKSAEQAEVFFTAVDDTPVIFEANRLKQLQTSEGMMVALRLVRKGRIGFSTATSLDDIGSLVSRAVEVAQFGAEPGSNCRVDSHSPRWPCMIQRRRASR